MSISTCPVFEPNLEEFENFERYVQKIQSAYDIGICKIIPPKGWYERSYSMGEIGHIVVPSPIKQVVEGCSGVYDVDLFELKPMSIQDLLTYSERHKHILDLTPEERERKFWKSIGNPCETNHPIYGADIIGTLFQNQHAYSWNVNQLHSVLNLLEQTVPGVNCSYLYIGTWRALFAYHVEDCDLYSINYLHTGAPKSWYSISPYDKQKFEIMATTHFSIDYKECKQFLRHKTKLFSPLKLKQYHIPYHTVIQYPGEFVITFPGSYHAGYNHGFNIAEATNFATPAWFNLGKQTKPCVCRPNSVRIDVLYLETLYLRQFRKKNRQESNTIDIVNSHMNSDIISTTTVTTTTSNTTDLSEEVDCYDNLTMSNTTYHTRNKYRIRCSCKQDYLLSNHNNTKMSTSNTIKDKDKHIYECYTCGLWSHYICNQHLLLSTYDDINGINYSVENTDLLCYICYSINHTQEIDKDSLPKLDSVDIESKHIYGRMTSSKKKDLSSLSSSIRSSSSSSSVTKTKSKFNKNNATSSSPFQANSTNTAVTNNALIEETYDFNRINELSPSPNTEFESPNNKKKYNKRKSNDEGYINIKKKKDFIQLKLGDDVWVLKPIQDTTNTTTTTTTLDDSFTTQSSIPSLSSSSSSLSKKKKKSGTNNTMKIQMDAIYGDYVIGTIVGYEDNMYRIHRKGSKRECDYWIPYNEIVAKFIPPPLPLSSTSTTTNNGITSIGKNKNKNSLEEYMKNYFPPEVLQSMEASNSVVDTTTTTTTTTVTTSYNTHNLIHSHNNGGNNNIKKSYHTKDKKHIKDEIEETLKNSINDDIVPMKIQDSAASSTLSTLYYYSPIKSTCLSTTCTPPLDTNITNITCVYDIMDRNTQTTCISTTTSKTTDIHDYDNDNDNDNLINTTTNDRLLADESIGILNKSTQLYDVPSSSSSSSSSSSVPSSTSVFNTVLLSVLNTDYIR